MSEREEIISRIIEMEWKMFQDVQNVGGRASCQEDFGTFRINRISQAEGWSELALKSYLNDLEIAEKECRNLLSEKYARMMESTSPSEYERIAHHLPPLDDEIINLADRIVQIVIEWEQELADKYPHIVKRGRPLRSSHDTVFITSVETYLRGELFTYSKTTLEQIYDDYQEKRIQNINGSEIILEHMVKEYGYTSLEHANSVITSRS